jgi:hypothetical protein
LLMIIAVLVTYGSMALFIIPGIIIAIYTCLNIFTLVIDGKKGLSALNESYLLIKGKWWKVLGRILFIVLLAAAAMFILQIGTTVLSVILGFILPPVILAIVSFIIMVIFEAVLAAYGMTYMYLLYASLKTCAVRDDQSKGIRGWLIAFTIIGALVLIIYIGMIIFVFSSAGPMSFPKGVSGAGQFQTFQSSGMMNNSFPVK